MSLLININRLTGSQEILYHVKIYMFLSPLKTLGENPLFWVQYQLQAYVNGSECWENVGSYLLKLVGALSGYSGQSAYEASEILHKVVSKSNSIYLRAKSFIFTSTPSYQDIHISTIPFSFPIHVKTAHTTQLESKVKVIKPLVNNELIVNKVFFMQMVEKSKEMER
ncbi:hypothetical protein RND71_019219 [Anisodus tanguticus]|uniref:Uncharacterized protein n=1 Tax=Anisodus tanguticus TaxID=243964 RepID=A0AAE1RZ20_9SOLA|nr:hypothetical protein RND71_019219 [Anisodus tanguticus]